MEVLHLHITIYGVLWISTYNMYLGDLSLDCAGCAVISEGHCYIDDVRSVYFSVRTYHVHPTVLQRSAGRSFAVIK